MTRRLAQDGRRERWWNPKAQDQLLLGLGENVERKTIINNLR